MSKKIVVIGGGAAGMMAAVFAARQGADVTLIEPNERLGKKVNITGKGRCNVTNNCALEELLRNVPGNGRFLYSAFSKFDGRDAMAFFEELGVPLKTERGSRVFPVSDCAFDVTAALERELRRRGVQVIRDRALNVETAEGRVAAVRGERRRYEASAVILATGGVSYPATGSTGDGYRIAAALGHTVAPPHGSLVPLVSPDPCCQAMQGLALKNVTVTVEDGQGRRLFRELGEMLFTHFGVSGPLILSASARMREAETGTCRLLIDLKPGLDEQKLDARILRDINESPNRDFEKIVSGLVPHSMVAVLCRRLEIPDTLKAHSLTRQQRRDLVRMLKHFAIEITDRRPVEEAIVTAGGVNVGEVQPATMESKLVRGLYFAGEILDVDAYTGGFNLQIAWATGRQAGLCAARE
ncbi:MAG: NAD(P)/FAD-dependent oxidoreductase [Oscillospiraceae bacterium]|nr:NAD(P)/FAD-dependent oxidoreductase [Oscillospiraceae bacterium]